MIFRPVSRLAYTIMAGLIVFSMFFAVAANNIVPVTYLTDQSSVITANDLKPAACSAITVTIIVYCPAAGGNCDGTAANELIIGTPNVDIIQGKGGADCILGGDGNDDLTGSQSSDVCVGGPGTDTFKKCEVTIQ